MYAILGASGNTGKLIAEKLLARGEKVRAIARNPEHLAGLETKGAEPFTADAGDTAALTRALSGARAAYVLLPPSLAAPDLRAFQEKISDATSTAIEKSGVEYAVLLSSVGADKADKTGPVVGLHAFEQKLDRIKNLNAVYLRAGYFMENVMAQVGVIKHFGVVGGPLRSDLSVAMIATKDIGNFAADILAKLDFSGKRARELLGPRDVNYEEIAGIIGRAIGRPALGYMQLSASQLKPALMSMGMSASVADAVLEMSEALNRGHMAPLEVRTPHNSTPTTIEQFVAEVFVPAFKAS